jgi:DNA polymerase III sliding clamp (beta) subunit (PCNA family)
LIDAKYFDYMKSIPALGSNVLIDRVEVLDAVRRLAILAAKESDVQIDFETSELKLSIDGAGEGNEIIRVEGEIPGALIAISPSQIVDALSLPAGEIVHLHVEPGKQYIRMVDPAEPSAIFLESTRIPRRQRMAA